MMWVMKKKNKEVVGVGSLCMLLMLLSSSVMLINYFATTTASTVTDAPGGIRTTSSSFYQQEKTGSMKMSHSSSSRSSSTTTGRKLKASHQHSGSQGGVGGDVSLEDYRPIDPSPSSSSKAIRPGPIQHGTHLNPYIPTKPPSPAPNHPKLDDNEDTVQ